MTSVFSGLSSADANVDRESTILSDHRWLAFSDEYQPTRSLVADLDLIHNRVALRETLFPFAAPFDLTRFNDEEAVFHVAARMVTGRLEAVPRFEWRGAHGDAADVGAAQQAEPEEEPPAEEPPPPPPASEEETAWIKFKVVDDETGDPVKGVTLHVKTPDGKTRQVRSGADGMAEINGILPGSCSIERIVDSDALEIKAVE
jgi:hypothetical protein